MPDSSSGFTTDSTNPTPMSTTPQTDDLLAQLRLRVNGNITARVFLKDLNDNYLTQDTQVSTSTVGRWLYGKPFKSIISSESALAIQQWLSSKKPKTK